MLQIIRSPLPAVPTDPSTLPTTVADFLRSIEQSRHCHWIVPTGRRRRAMPKQWLERMKSPASFLPAFHTMESFVARALEFSLHQRPRINDPERLLRVARAWQETLGRAAGGGFVHQLDRFIRDWQACNMPIPARPNDIFEKIVKRYLADLHADGRADRMTSVTALARELADPNSQTTRLFLPPSTKVLFDGFYRLEPIELMLIAALAQSCEVWLWLVGVPGRRYWETLQVAAQILQEKVPEFTITDVLPPPSSLATLGRNLFRLPTVGQVSNLTHICSQVENLTHEYAASLSAIYQVEAADPAAEVENVARRIKSDYYLSQQADCPLRLSDFAVVVPNPDYDPLIREIFPRMGLEFNLAGRSLVVSRSRPARLILSALQLIQGQWRHDLLLDFLMQPMVKRLLEGKHLLNELFGHRPRARKPLDYTAWSDSWNKLADGFQSLVASIRHVLGPVAALDQFLASSSEHGEPLRSLVHICGDLLRAVKINTWLAVFDPTTQDEEPHIPWIELEKDQQAYYKVLGILESLQALPGNRIPLNLQEQPDALTALLLALDAETYQVKSQDDAGVQVFEIREIRGLTFRRVFALGLAEGEFPSLPEEGVVASHRLQYLPLREQLQQNENETAYLFTQLFEAAGEMLVLSRHVLADDRKMPPSPFLMEVQGQCKIPHLEIPDLVGSWPDAQKRLGEFSYANPEIPITVPALWPNVPPNQQAQVDRVLADLLSYRHHKARREHIAIDAPALLRVLFPDDRPFNPSELETYAACPFRFFGSRILRLDERDTDETRTHYGSLIHNVFQQFYEELRHACSGPANHPLPPITRGHFPRLLQIFEDEWAKLAAGALPPDLQTLFHQDQGVLDLFFEAIQTIEKEYGNYLNEFVLRTADGKPVLLGMDQCGRPVSLTGKIDRVDLGRSDPTRVIILDYKTGKVVSRKSLIDKLNDGRMLQLPLYAAALKLIRPELLGIGGAYIHLHEKTENGDKAILPVGEWLPIKGKRGPIPFAPAQALAKAVSMAGDIRAGRFPLTEHNVDRAHVECTAYCPMRHACRHPKGYESSRY